MHIYSIRYMWKILGSTSVNFKIITDTEDSLKAFEKAVLDLSGLESFGKEYLHEYDVSRVGVFEKIFSKES